MPAMRATCPSCEAVYEIPDRLVGTGRRLRCTNCGHKWNLLPPPAEAPAAAAPEPARMPPPAPPAPAYLPAEPRGAPSHGPMLRRPPQLIDPPLPPVDDNGEGWRGGTATLRAAWIGSVLVVVLMLAAFWTFRYEIATAWPPAARLTGSPVGGG
jgi:predicted Zn finger-like uncharacterized protein